MSRISFEVEVHSSQPNLHTPRKYHACFPGKKGELSLAIGSSYKNEADARKSLKNEVIRILSDTKEAEENSEILLIGCNNGIALLVRRMHSWGYAIAGKDRKHIGSGMWGLDSFFDACVAACRYADSTCGGVAWKSLGNM